MFPPKIKELLSELKKLTEKGILEWSYDDDLSRVTTMFKENELQITYTFNETKEMGEFFVRLITEANKQYFFGADQSDIKDYELAKTLFDLAQSTDLDLDFSHH